MDWSLFRYKGTRDSICLVPYLAKSPSAHQIRLNELTEKSCAMHTERNEPPKTECSEASYLQKTVRNSESQSSTLFSSTCGATLAEAESQT